MKNIRKLIAFTLAETLVVMGIIGVVAALTIPNLSKNTGNAEKVAKVKKIYAELNEAHNRATAVYGPLASWSGGVTATRYYDRITEFMKLQKDCRISTSGCMGTSYTCFDGTCNGFSTCLTPDSTSYPRAIIASGWSFRYYQGSNSCNNNSYGYDNTSCGYLQVDIDGPNKGKNTAGIDMFLFIVTKDGIKPYGGGSYWSMTSTKNLKTECFSKGLGCTEWVIRNDNMDYLDASHESDAGKCNHSDKTLSTTVLSCK